MNTLGQKIKYLRKEMGLNQEELAQALNERFELKIDRVMISKWETGFQTPVINTIKYIASFFGVSLDYLNGNEIPTKHINLTPCKSPKTQALLVFNKNGTAGAHKKIIPSDDVVNEINKLVKALMPYPAEQISALLKIVENGGNIPIKADMPSDLKELVAEAASLTESNIKTLVQVAKSMK